MLLFRSFVGIYSRNKKASARQEMLPTGPGLLYPKRGSNKSNPYFRYARLLVVVPASLMGSRSSSALGMASDPLAQSGCAFAAAAGAMASQECYATLCRENFAVRAPRYLQFHSLRMSLPDPSCLHTFSGLVWSSLREVFSHQASLPPAKRARQANAAEIAAVAWRHDVSGLPNPLAAIVETAEGSDTRDCHRGP